MLKRRLSPDAMYPAREPDVRVRRLVLGGGVGVRVLELGPENGAPVLLVHGWAACVFTFRHLLRALAAEGRRAIAFDLPGHGLSDKPRTSAAYTTAAVLEHMAGVLDGLGIARADVGGHSLGGGAALLFARAYPQRVRRLILAAPTNIVPVRMRLAARLVSPPLLDAIAAHVVRRALVVGVLRGVSGREAPLDERAIDEYWAPSRDPGYYAAASALLRFFDWRPLADEALHAIAAPALVLLGRRDPLIPHAAAAARALPHHRTLVLPDAGHLVLDESPARANDAIVRFLAESDDEVRGPAAGAKFAPVPQAMR